MQVDVMLNSLLSQYNSTAPSSPGGNQPAAPPPTINAGNGKPNIPDPPVINTVPLGKKAGKVAKAQVEKAVEKLNNASLVFGKRFYFRVHESSHRIQVQVTDIKTNKILKEFPPKEILDIVARMRELAGVMVDKSG